MTECKINKNIKNRVRERVDNAKNRDKKTNLIWIEVTDCSGLESIMLPRIC